MHVTEEFFKRFSFFGRTCTNRHYVETSLFKGTIFQLMSHPYFRGFLNHLQGADVSLSL